MKSRLFLLMSSVTLAGCHFGGGFTHIAPSVGSNTSAPNEEFMYLDLNEAYYDTEGVEPPLYEINTTEEAGDSDRRDSVSNCEILYDEDEPAAPELICILDYMEEEFLLYDLSFVLNVPKGMCATLRTMPAWHYNLPAGNGPPVLCQVKEKSGDEDNEETEESLCLPTGWDKDRPETWTGSVSCPTTIGSECSQEAEDLCPPYIHTRLNGDKINCCLKDYTVTGTDSGEESWGGNVQNCLGGPGRTSWNLYDEEGFPVWLTEYILEDGLRRTFDITNLIEVARGGRHSTPIANYMKDFDKPLEELHEDSWEDFPTFLNQNNGLSLGSPFYIFECRDSAGEILHQINLMIREWNTYEEFFAYYDSGGSDESADPDVGGLDGVEGDDCEYENRQLFSTNNLCNDYLDLDDILDLNADYPNARYE